jgi:hypothetical protein
VSVSELHDADAVIVAVVDPTTGERAFKLCVGANVIRSAATGRELSRYAFDNGANSVRWDFDLALDEPNRYAGRTHR